MLPKEWGLCWDSCILNGQRCVCACGCGMSGGLEVGYKGWAGVDVDMLSPKIHSLSGFPWSPLRGVLLSLWLQGHSPDTSCIGAMCWGWHWRARSHITVDLRLLVHILAVGLPPGEPEVLTGSGAGPEAEVCWRDLPQHVG